MRLSLKISFDAEKISAIGMLATFLPVLHFKLKAIRSIQLNEEGYIELGQASMLKKLEEIDPPIYNIADAVYDWEDVENNVFFYRYDSFAATRFCMISSEEANTQQLEAYINAAAPKGFFMAYYYNPLNTIEQSEKIISNLDYKGKPHSHLKKIFDPLLEEEVIDIFENPGHEILTNNTWLYAAPEMWFGKNALEYFNKETLINYPHAKEAKILNNGVVYIKLFDAAEENYETAEILNLQKDFREYSGMNEIEKYFNDIYEARLFNKPIKTIRHRINVKPENKREEE